jgi:hypothetical protein
MKMNKLIKHFELREQDYVALYRAGEQDFFSVKELGVESRGMSHGRVVFDRPGELFQF